MPEVETSTPANTPTAIGYQSRAAAHDEPDRHHRPV